MFTAAHLLSDFPGIGRLFRWLAERVGFEPTVRKTVHLISSQARSTTPASLLSAFRPTLVERLGGTRKVGILLRLASARNGVMGALFGAGWPLLLFSLAGCGPSLEPPGKSGELVVMTRNAPNTYFLDKEGRPSGFEYELVKRFADSKGWKLRLEVAEDLQALRTALDEGRVHLAAGWLAVTPERQRRYRFGPSYAEEKEWVICRAGLNQPRAIPDLATLRLEVAAGSSHEETLKRLRKHHASLHWSSMRVASEEELLERVASGLTDCTVADEVTLDLADSYLSDLAKAFDLGQPQLIAWAMPWRAPKGLRNELQHFFQTLVESGDLQRLQASQLGWQEQPMGEVDLLRFMERRAERLHDLRGYFRQAQVETDMDWRLLAAIAYQESQWDPRAVSPTGVRGIMMLTVETADRMEVENRLDPKQSILGGARYINLLRDGIPDRIPEPDRTWLALAAYNIGLGHLQDARRLTQKLGKDPDKWKDVRDVLPLIARANYASKLRYGYARGGEARQLVENVRLYYDMLRRLESPYVYGFAAMDGGTGRESIIAP